MFTLLWRCDTRSTHLLLRFSALWLSLQVHHGCLSMMPALSRVRGAIAWRVNCQLLSRARLCAGEKRKTQRCNNALSNQRNPDFHKIRFNYNSTADSGTQDTGHRTTRTATASRGSDLLKALKRTWILRLCQVSSFVGACHCQGAFAKVAYPMQRFLHQEQKTERRRQKVRRRGGSAVRSRHLHCIALITTNPMAEMATASRTRACVTLVSALWRG